MKFSLRLTATLLVLGLLGFGGFGCDYSKSPLTLRGFQKIRGSQNSENRNVGIAPSGEGTGGNVADGSTGDEAITPTGNPSAGSGTAGETTVAGTTGGTTTGGESCSTSCEAIDFQCGGFTNSCGQFVDCGSCAEGEGCFAAESGGLGGRRCRALPAAGATTGGTTGGTTTGGTTGGTTASTCTPIPGPDACRNKQCGSVSDGCGGTYGCGGCGDDEHCNVSNNTCEAANDPTPPSTTTQPGNVHVFTLNSSSQVVYCKGSPEGAWSNPSCTTLAMKSQTPVTTLYQPTQPSDPTFPQGGVIHIFGTNGNWLTYAYCPANDASKCKTEYQSLSQFPMQESPSAVLSKDGTIYLFSRIAGQWSNLYATAIKGKGRDSKFEKINTDPSNLMSNMMLSTEWGHCANPNTAMAAVLTRDASGKERIDVFSSGNLVHMWTEDLANVVKGWKCSYQNSNNFLTSRPAAFPVREETLGGIIVFGPNPAKLPAQWTVYGPDPLPTETVLTSTLTSLAVFTANDQTIPAAAVTRNGDDRTTHYFFTTTTQGISHASLTTSASTGFQTLNSPSNNFSAYKVMPNSQPAVAIDPSGNINVFAVKQNEPGSSPALLRYVGHVGSETFTQGEIVQGNILNHSFASPAAVFTP